MHKSGWDAPENLHSAQASIGNLRDTAKQTDTAAQKQSIKKCQISYIGVYSHSI